jgi:hypothetical protein
LWGKQWSGKNILFYCANIATVQIIKNGRFNEPLINEIYETSEFRATSVCGRRDVGNTKYTYQGDSGLSVLDMERI